jgi:hypothetical protein
MAPRDFKCTTNLQLAAGLLAEFYQDTRSAKTTMRCRKPKLHSDRVAISVRFTRWWRKLQALQYTETTWRRRSSNKRDKLPHLPLEAIEFRCSPGLDDRGSEY